MKNTLPALRILASLFLSIGLLFLIDCGGGGGSTPLEEQSIFWTGARQFGENDPNGGALINSMLTDKGSVIVTGSYNNASGAFVQTGSFLIKYSPTGEQQWNYTVSGTSLYSSVANDSKGNIYFSVYRSLGSNQYQGSVKKFSPSGSILWNQDFTSSLKVVVDSADNLYVVSANDPDTQHITIRKYTPEGQSVSSTSILQSTPFNTYISSVAFSNGKMILVATGKLMALDSNMQVLWEVTATAFSNIAIDGAGNIYLSDTYSSLAPISKYSPNGTLLWTQSNQALGYNGFHTVDAAGNVSMLIYKDKLYFAKRDTDGNLISNTQISQNTGSYYVGQYTILAFVPVGSGYVIGGITMGAFPGQTLHGKYDAFIAKTNEKLEIQ